MVLKGVHEIDWFTDLPDRVADVWSPKKLLKEWDVLFSAGAGAPNAQSSFEMSSERKLVTSEMFKPKLSGANQTLSFKVRVIGEKNKDLLTGLKINAYLMRHYLLMMQVLLLKTATCLTQTWVIWPSITRTWLKQIWLKRTWLTRHTS